MLIKILTMKNKNRELPVIHPSDNRKPRFYWLNSATNSLKGIRFPALLPPHKPTPPS